jgi:ABC-type transporter Mla subunit MlaD
MRRLRTGFFLVASMTVVLAILFFLGGRDLFSKKIRACTYFDESVQGLNRGAAVKFKGATIGTVSDIRIIFPNYVLVEMEIDVSRFTGTDGDFEAAFLAEVQKKGLCCRLEYAGITGLKFIDFDYHQTDDKSKNKREPPSFIGKTDAVYVPSVSSSFADISTSVAGAIDKLNQINIKEMSEEITAIMRDLRALISDPALAAAVHHLSEVAANLENASGMLGRVIDEERLENLIASFETSLKDLKTLIRHMDEAASGANIPESAAAFRNSAAKVADGAAAMQDASAAVVNGQQELSNTLLKLNQTIDSLRMLIEYIESDPGALLRGKNRSDEEK